MKNFYKVLLALVLISSFNYSSTITFTGADGSISPSQYSAEGISIITNGYIISNRLEQDNIDVPGAITITFSSLHSSVTLEYYRDIGYRLGNTTVTAYDADAATGNSIAAHSLSADGTFNLVGSNNIKSIQITGVYDGYGGFNAFDNLYFGEPALPVELVSFQAEIVNGSKISLLWKTETEVNNYGFEVEKNTNFKSDASWEKIGFVNGHGNSSSPKYYNFADENFVIGTVEYRLKQLDLDGNYEYSNVISLEIKDDQNDFKLYQNHPNPFNPTTSITYFIPPNNLSYEKEKSLKIFNVLGKELAEFNLENSSPGKNSIKIDGSNFPSGVYYYRINIGEYMETKKMILTK